MVELRSYITAIPASAVLAAVSFLAVSTIFPPSSNSLPHASEVRQLREVLPQFNDPKSVDRNILRDTTDPKQTKVWCQPFNTHRQWISLKLQDLQAKEMSIPDFYANDECVHDYTNSLVFFHVGKAGGGTIEEDLKTSRIGFSASHPWPRDDQVQGLKTGPYEKLIINVRDPVDRHVSAFYWSLYMCAKKGQVFCAGEQEQKLMVDKYKSNANVLAEALCEESPNLEEAEEDFSMMSLMRHKIPLTGWLGFLIDPNQQGSFTEDGINELIVVPMEKQQGQESSFFKQHVQRMVLHVLRSKFGTAKTDELLEQQPKNDDAEAEKVHHHSSIRLGETLPLSPLGECCMARKLRGDYRLIQTMLGTDEMTDGSDLFVHPLPYAHPAVSKACLWGTEDQQELCKSDLKSILSRRARYLDKSLGTCSRIVANDIALE